MSNHTAPDFRPARPLGYYPLAAVAALVLISCAAAQSEPDSITHRNNCHLAARIVATGHPAPDEEWAFGYISSCPAEAGEAIASAMRINRNTTDTLLLNNLTWSTRILRDAAVLDAALEIAGDKGASFEARIFSLRSLYWMTELYPRSMGLGTIRFGTLARGDKYPDSKRCLIGTMTDVYVNQGANALPADYLDQIDRLAARLEADPTENGDIRGVAWCIQGNQ